ncbi:hypothetical protein SCUP234_04666 [Seiridium cupressi]
MFATRPIVRCVVWRDLRPRKYERGARALSARVGITIMYLANAPKCYYVWSAQSSGLPRIVIPVPRAWMALSPISDLSGLWLFGYDPSSPKIRLAESAREILAEHRQSLR